MYTIFLGVHDAAYCPVSFLCILFASQNNELRFSHTSFETGLCNRDAVCFFGVRAGFCALFKCNSPIEGLNRAFPVRIAFVCCRRVYWYAYNLLQVERMAYCTNFDNATLQILFRGYIEIVHIP
jgi:hypothetical protein